jgi:hypothetical protein
MSLASRARACALLTALFCVPALGAQDVEWLTEGPDGQQTLVLYYFYSDSCPHCQDAKPFVAELAETEWLDVRRYEISKNYDNGRLYWEMAKDIGEKGVSVPGFLYCGKLETGYDAAETTGRKLLSELEACRADPVSFLAPPEDAALPAAAEGGIQLPLIGTIDPSRWGLPLLTAVIAGLDAFNPCAFFVLLFLLSLMVHARSRARMLLVGGTFVLISGAIYFVFMAAWLNVFLWIGELRVVTMIAGLVAVGLAAINIKDYFWFNSGGPSLSIPDSKKPGMYQRMRNLVAAPGIPSMLMGTAILAIVVNSYELLCTAGLPMVYTRILTLREADSLVFYLYLLFYNIVYVIPLLAIVGLFVMKFGARKLGESEGRVLKLMSGMMMLGLGAVMLFSPMALNNAGIAIGLLLGAVLTTSLIHAVMRRRGLI